jgi:hypothetical protein
VMVIDGAANKKILKQKSTSQTEAPRVETYGGRLHFVVREKQRSNQKQ